MSVDIYMQIDMPSVYEMNIIVLHHLTHCGLVTTYGGIDLGKHWLGQ